MLIEQPLALPGSANKAACLVARAGHLGQQQDRVWMKQQAYHIRGRGRWKGAQLLDTDLAWAGEDLGRDFMEINIPTCQLRGHFLLESFSYPNLNLK